MSGPGSPGMKRVRRTDGTFCFEVDPATRPQTSSDPPVSFGMKAWRLVVALIGLCACWVAVVGLVAFVASAVEVAGWIVELAR